MFNGVSKLFAGTRDIEADAERGVAFEVVANLAEDPTAELEDQAQRELQEWKAGRDPLAPPPSTSSPTPPPPPAEEALKPKEEPKKSKFSPMPWLKLK